MARSIAGALTFQNVSATGNPGEYAFAGAVFDNQADTQGEGTSALAVGFLVYIQASDSIGLFPIPGVMHRYKLTSLTIVDSTTIDGMILWNEAGDELDVPTEFSVGVISSVSIASQGYPISELVYQSVPSGAGFSIINADSNATGGELGGYIAAEFINGHKILTLNSLGQVIPASADVLLHHRILGISVNAAIAGNNVQVINNGIIEHQGWSLIIEQPIYVGLAGTLTQTLPSSAKFVKVVGVAVDVDKILVDFQPTIVLTNP